MSQKLEHDELDAVNEALSKSELFLLKNQKTIYAVIGAVVAVLAIVVCVRYFYIIPREERAAAAAYPGTFYFEADSFQVALKGDGKGFIGYEAVADQYGSTDAGNLANAYAGISCMRLGDYENAKKYLSAFDANDNMIAPVIVGAIGDCYVQLDQPKEAILYFEKAAAKADNNLISPIYLKKAGIAYESLKENEKALKVYRQIKDEYPNSVEAMDIDKYIEKVSNAK